MPEAGDARPIVPRAAAPLGTASILRRLRGVRDYGGIAVLGVGLWLLLIETNAFYSSVLASILIWTVATSGLNIIAGLGGYPSLMQGAFYGIGAYASALAMIYGGHPLWLAGIEAIAAAAVAGFVVGIVFSRTRGQYFAIGTMFSGLVVALVLSNWRTLTNGRLGLNVPFAFDDFDQVNILIAAATALTLALVRFIGRRRLGLRLLTILEDEDLAEHLGVPTARTKLAGFVLSACVGALAGVLFGQYNGTISPDSFDYYVGFVMFVALSVGGAGRVLGPLLGSAFIVGVPQLLNLSSGIGLLVVGLIFVVVTILIPGGFMSAVDGLVMKAKRLAATR
jgi:branched-chain amino acid transport system permease protein